MPVIDETTRVVVAGGRNFDDRVLVYDTLDRLTRKLPNFCIVTGAAKGADRLAEDWASARRVTYVRFHPDWNTHGKAAGPIRNKEICEFAVLKKPAFAVLFWDGESPGTADMLRLCKKYKIHTRVIRTEED